MKQYNKICVFDLETDGINPNVCSPVQIASVIIDPLKLEIVDNSEFNLFIRPDKLDDDPDHKYDNDILGFHAKVRGCSQEDILKSWQSATPQKQAWEMFNEYLNKYHLKNGKKSQFSAPIAAGYNIYRFDLRITSRLSKKYGTTNKEGESSIFFPRDILDIMNLCYYWLSNTEDLKSLSLDNIRDYMGISKDQAHDALKDVKDCANILIRFLKLHKNLSSKIKFKNAFSN